MALENKKAVVRSYVFQGMTVEKGCELVGISRHQYYYRQRATKRRGVKASKETKKLVGGKMVIVDNEEVVKAIIKNHENSDLRYGYKKMTIELQTQGFMINSKKVRRIMRTQWLLQKGKRNTEKKRVAIRRANSKRPYEIIEMDIKYLSMEGYKNRFIYVFTILDTFTREVLYWTAGYQMKQAQIRKAWQYVIVNHLQGADIINKELKVEIRSDNGSQFEAKMIQQYLKDNYLEQVFTHPYTPQENGHIESFHAILSTAINNESFVDLEHATKRLKVFYDTYNNIRLHGSICHLPPVVFKLLWQNGHLSLIKNGNKTGFKLNVRYCEVNELIKMLKNKKTYKRAMRA